jgi:hypothetical protein
MAELVERHNASERQLKFREQYQPQIHPLYGGPVHIAVKIPSPLVGEG